MALANKIVFVQYLFALAVVQALQNISGAEQGLGICIKWPNDIYVDTKDSSQRYRKLGGILVNSSYQKGDFTLVVGQSLCTFFVHCS